MNSSMSPRKTLILLITGLTLCVIGIAGMLLFRFYGGLILLVPLGVFYVWQLVQYLRSRQG